MTNTLLLSILYDCQLLSYYMLFIVAFSKLLLIDSMNDFK